MRRAFAYWQLIRVHNCLAASASVAVGQYLLPQTKTVPLHYPALAVAFFVCAFGNVLNDIVDIRSDAINHPKRPLPAGIISVREASLLAGIFVVISLLLLIPLHPLGRVIALAAVGLVVWYDLKLKRTAYWGNLAVSILAGLTFLLGGAAVGRVGLVELPGPVIAAVFAVLMHMGREIIKDIADHPGDAATGAKTAPVRSGDQLPFVVAASLFVVLSAGAVAVYLLDWFTRAYFLPTVLLVCFPLGGLILWMAQPPRIAKCRFAAVIIKLEMIIGLAALVLGKNY